MSDLLRRLKSKINEIYGEDALHWFESHLIVDWIVVLGIFLLGLYLETQPAFERDFSPNDPLIQHPHKHQQVSSFSNFTISIAMPGVLSVFIAIYRKSIHEIHHGSLSLAAGRAVTHLITEALKNRIGRLRPDFLARCQWDPLERICTGDVSDILDGRKSFPSGHSSTAFVGMTFLSLFLAGKTAGLCFAVSSSPVSFLRSRLTRLCLVLAPLFFASWVAITRIEDYRHHKEDVIVGGLIGIFSGTICYLHYWPNPFSVASFSSETKGRPRLASGDSSRSGYRLATEAPEFD
ncbi:lipid phosphate phosphatase 1 [Lactifluus volemus]|nr:lipid phosphate phosphatase 1 [Lactifluus volemus]